VLKQFIAEREDQPAGAWLERFHASRAEAERWYLGERHVALPAADECRAALTLHMPELAPHYDRACALAGADEMARRILSHYRPADGRGGCSQAVWLGEDGPALIRNFDFPLEVISERIELTNWSGRRVICKAQRPWGGCLDGMNEDGLAASVTLGGRRVQGRGFAIILMLRYVLETCTSVDEAVAALSRIPVALPQNVTLLDRTGAYATLFLGPHRPPAVTRLRACTNHQEAIAGRQNSVLRQQTLLELLADPSIDLAALTARFLEAPLYSRKRGFTTAYTALYRPAVGEVEFRWPGKSWRLGFDRFEASEYTHDYGDLT
jgi:predicted choloylglycine hydrolase